MTFPRVILKRCYCEMSVSNLLKGGFLGVRYLYQARDYKMKEIIPPYKPLFQIFFSKYIFSVRSYDATENNN